jgi:hypothetical protein
VRASNPTSIRISYKSYKINISAGLSEAKRPLGVRRCRWENNIAMGLKGRGYMDVEWIDLDLIGYSVKLC